MGGLSIETSLENSDLVETFSKLLKQPPSI